MGNKRTRLQKYDQIKETKKRDTTPAQEQVPIDDEVVPIQERDVAGPSQSIIFFFGMANLMEMDENTLFNEISAESMVAKRTLKLHSKKIGMNIFKINL